MSFADRLDVAVEVKGTPTLVGIDPHLDLLPEEFAVARDEAAPRAERADALARFGCQLCDVVADRVAVVKPQSAFFEVLGADGALAFERVCRHARASDLLVLGDVKRSDIASTASAYATAFLRPAAGEPALCDAITVSPYLGADTLEPFVDVCRETGAGLFVLVRTSNPGSGSYQLHGEPPLWRRVAETVDALGTEFVGRSGYSSLGAVVGATHADELAELRAALPRTTFLLPGYGAQGAGAADVAAAFPDRTHPWRGGLVNSSRGIAFAWRERAGLHWKDAASAALDDMVADLAGALAIPTL